MFYFAYWVYDKDGGNNSVWGSQGIKGVILM